MKTTVLICRLLLGFIFLIFGLDYFIQFLSKIITFPALNDKANNFLGAFAAVGYFFPMLKSIEIICGLLLIINRYAAFITVVLFPVTVNIFLLHAFLAPQFLFLGGGMLLLNLILLYAYRKNYSGIMASVPRI